MKNWMKRCEGSVLALIAFLVVVFFACRLFGFLIARLLIALLTGGAR